MESATGKNIFQGFLYGMKIPVVKTLPLKKLPDILFYQEKGTPFYKMIDVKRCKNVGFMEAAPIVFNKQNVFYIKWLLIFQKRQNFGTKFLDFASNISKQSGCDGKLLVKAATTVFDPHNPPHIFYRKYGFTCSNKKLLKKIDKHIKNNKQLNYRQTPPVDMFYPGSAFDKKSLWQRLKDKFKI